MRAEVIIFNSIEEFKDVDKKDLLSATGQELWKVVSSQKGRETPNLLNSALLLMFPDLKSHEYTYWYVYCRKDQNMYLSNPKP